MIPRLSRLAFASGLAWLCAGDNRIPAAVAETEGQVADALMAPARVGPPPADLASLRDYRVRVENELRGDILPFWLQHARNRERGGFWGEISNDLTVKSNAPRGALLTARILWTFSAAYRRYQDPAYLEMARWAYDDLQTTFWDQERGGLYWSATAPGKPLDTRKQIYVQVFGVYGLSEYHRATGEPAALDRAIELYRLIEAHAHDRKNGGYFEAFTRDWKPQTNLRRSAMELYASKSQNTHLHVMEAFTNLLRVWPDPELRRDQRELVEIMLTRILNPANHHLWLFLDADWTPLTRTISFGHDIEASWLLTEAAGVIGDPDLLARARSTAQSMAQAVLAEGVDANGGLNYEAVPGGALNRRKEWWPQAEATVGFLNAYQLTHDERFLRAVLRTWDFIEAQLIDRKYGEWYYAILGDGAISPQPKVGFWKCPYHNSRACLELVERLRAIEASGASGGAGQ
jgi:mannobiose 2-epimerase